MTDAHDTWKHVRTLADGERFEISGLNIWDSHWESTGESIHIKDPLYGQDHTFRVYKINNEHVSVTFAAGEFSNCIWGIYLKKQIDGASRH